MCRHHLMKSYHSCSRLRRTVSILQGEQCYPPTCTIRNQTGIHFSIGSVCSWHRRHFRRAKCACWTHAEVLCMTRPLSYPPPLILWVPPWRLRNKDCTMDNHRVRSGGKWNESSLSWFPSSLLEDCDVETLPVPSYSRLRGLNARLPWAGRRNRRSSWMRHRWYPLSREAQRRRLAVSGNNYTRQYNEIYGVERCRVGGYLCCGRGCWAKSSGRKHCDWRQQGRKNIRKKLPTRNGGMESKKRASNTQSGGGMRNLVQQGGDETHRETVSKTTSLRQQRVGWQSWSPTKLAGNLGQGIACGCCAKREADVESMGCGHVREQRWWRRNTVRQRAVMPGLLAAGRTECHLPDIGGP